MSIDVHRSQSASLCQGALLAGWIVVGLSLTGCTAGNHLSAADGVGDQPANGSPVGVMNVADAAIAGGDPAMALKVSQSVLASDPDNLDALYHEAAAYYAVNRCMDAIAAYKVALTLQPASSQAELGIGRCLLKRNAAEAETAFAAAVADDPGNAAALNDLGIARDLQGHHQAAVQPYQQSLLLAPGNIATEVNLGVSFALAGDGQDALEYLGPLATGEAATPKIRQDYALALVAAGRSADARAVLAVDLSPDDAQALVNAFSTAIAQAQQPAQMQAQAAAQLAAQTATANAPVAATPASTTPVAAAPMAPVDITTVAATTPAVAPVMSPMTPAAPNMADQVVKPGTNAGANSGANSGATVVIPAETAAPLPPATISIAPGASHPDAATGDEVVR